MKVVEIICVILMFSTVPLSFVALALLSKCWGPAAWKKNDKVPLLILALVYLIFAIVPQVLRSVTK